MQLSEQEEKMVAWLRLQHANWRATRVIILVCSVGLLGYAVWLHWSGQSAWFFLPIVAMSAYGLSYTLGSWAGRPEISLLLKLVEHSKKIGKP